MKRIGIVLSILIALSLVMMPAAGCGSSKDSGNKASKETAQSTSGAETAQNTESAGQTDNEQPEEIVTDADPGTCEYQDMIVTYKRCEIISDEYGNSGLYVYFDFTNNSDQKKAFYTTFNASICQNGVELDDIVIVMTDNQAHDNFSGFSRFRTASRSLWR